MSALCQSLAGTLLAAHDDAGKPAFPPGGIRVLAYPAAHSAVADGGEAGRIAGGTLHGPGDYAFVYLNLRMATGRTPATQKRAGDAVLAQAKAHFEPLMPDHLIGLTVQVDESAGQVYDGKLSNLHPLFPKL